MRLVYASLLATALNVAGVPIKSACSTVYQDSPSCFESVATSLPPCGSIKEDMRRGTLFAQFGDYGIHGPCEEQVKQLVHLFEKTYRPVDFVFTTGDNNYWWGDCHTYHENVGQYYSKYIPKPKDCTNPALADALTWADDPMFWPTLGNHDWKHVEKKECTEGEVPFVRYFGYLRDLPGAVKNGTYYHVAYPFVDMFSLNSNLVEAADREAMFLWLRGQMESSKQPFKIVFFHHPPFTTATADPASPWLRQPYREWAKGNATIVFSGHEHDYERFDVGDNTPYVISGLGGHPWRYELTDCEASPTSKVRFNSCHGAVIGLVTQKSLQYCFYSVRGDLVDTVEIQAS
eukprot:TRINITY_DN56892_c0_g1_i1.p1 TRINITY_DN56892_c0_g1~~TRINITY_DN56892_c0_g1_i1.p1  ORF type:complete len:346 (-),score=36.05 TRINITY_DN56892_c0_g1_i1:13-1050(-)